MMLINIHQGTFFFELKQMSFDRQLSLCLFSALVLFLRVHITEGKRQETILRFLSVLIVVR